MHACAQVQEVLHQESNFAVDAAPAAVESEHPKQPAVRPGQMTHPAAHDSPPHTILPYNLLKASPKAQRSKFNGLSLSDCFLIGHVLADGPPDVNTSPA